MRRLRVRIDPTDLDSRYVEHNEVDDTPVDGATTVPVSSNWAYDHAANAAAHHSRYTDSEAVSALESESVVTLKKLEVSDDVAADTPTTGTVRLGEFSSTLVIKTPNGYLRLGPANTSWSHFFTDRANFYFAKGIAVYGTLRPYSDSAFDLGTASYAWRNAYADTIYEGGSALSSKYAAASHTHDDRYYTESEIDEMIKRYMIPLLTNTNTGLDGSSGDVTVSLDYGEYVQGSIIIPRTGTISIQYLLKCEVSNSAVSVWDGYVYFSAGSTVTGWTEGSIKTHTLYADKPKVVTIKSGLSVTAGQFLGIRIQNKESSYELGVCCAWIIYQ